MGGQFNNKNPGKRGISLNVRHPEGPGDRATLVAMSDIVAEGFSPGVLDSWGLGYDALRAIKPDIIYVQQSGMGAQGTYGRFRTVGPDRRTAFAGLSEMSGLPEPAMPAGWGYSYLDWMGAYSFALAILTGALPPRAHRAKGQWIDASQSEVGLFITGTTHPRLVGQRPDLDALRQPLAVQAGGAARRLSAAPATTAGSPSPASPTRSGARWPTSPEHPEWADDRALRRSGRAAGAPGRARRARRRLDADRRTPTRRMLALQRAGVPAGVCQTAEDRCDHDPQLAALDG